MKRLVLWPVVTYSPASSPLSLLALCLGCSGWIVKFKRHPQTQTNAHQHVHEKAADRLWTGPENITCSSTKFSKRWRRRASLSSVHSSLNILKWFYFLGFILLQLILLNGMVKATKLEEPSESCSAAFDQSMNKEYINSFEINRNICYFWVIFLCSVLYNCKLIDWTNNNQNK